MNLRTLLIVLALLAAVVAAGCGGASDDRDGEAAASANGDTTLGASGDQSRAVEAGQDADVVTFSTEPDMTRLVDAGIVEPTWKDGANEGLIAG